jgi:hypothetical protein
MLDLQPLLKEISEIHAGSKYKCPGARAHGGEGVVLGVC